MRPLCYDKGNIPLMNLNIQLRDNGMRIYLQAFVA